MKRVSPFETHVKLLSENIRNEEPRDLRRLCSGIVDTAAGSKGQYFTTLVFAHGELRSLAFHGLMHILRLLDDETIDIRVMRKLIGTLMESRVGFIDYLGLHETASIWREYLAVVHDTDDAQALRHATELLSEYGLRVHWWLEAMFPWELGASKTRIAKQDAEWLVGESGAAPWSERAFSG